MRISYWAVLKESVSSAINDKVTRLSASLAFYTVFALPALLLIVFGSINYILRDDAAESNFFRQLTSVIGSESSQMIRDTFVNTGVTNHTTLAGIAGIVMLLVASTGIFREMQDSLNQIFRVRLKSGIGIKATVLSRLGSFLMIIVLGVFLVSSLFISASLFLLINEIKSFFPGPTVYLTVVLDFALSMALMSLLFSLIYKVLPDVRVAWRDAFRGGLFTSVLFMIGKIGISFYLGKTSISSSYGAAGSILILLVWVYYSSILLYFGAEYTRSLAVKYGSGILPNDFSEWLNSSTGGVSSRYS